MNLFNELALLQKLGRPKGLENAILAYLRANKKVVSIAKTISDAVISQAQAVVGLAQINFFDNIAGVANYTQVVAGESEHRIIYGIRIMEGANASVPATNWTEGLATADVKNAELDIRVNGVIQLRALPLTVFTEADEDSQAGFYMFKVPIVWGGQERLEATVRFAVAPATANQNLQVQLYCVALI